MDRGSRDPFERAQALAREFLASLAAHPTGPSASVESLRRELGGPLPEEGRDPTGVVEALAAGAQRILVASAGPRCFGAGLGGTHPAAAAADWLVTAWNQNAASTATSPAAAVIEEIACAWVLDLLGLPGRAGVGLVASGTTANATCLGAARRAMLARAGWDVAARGLRGAPALRVLVGAEASRGLRRALALLGMGAADVTVVPTDAVGRLDPAALARALEDTDCPAIVCAQVGQVATGACDPVETVAELARRREVWVHVDGGFGLWAVAAPSKAPQLAGVAQADSWALPAHPWLNVPFDLSLAIVADREAHRAALEGSWPGDGHSGTSEIRDEASAREPGEWVPDDARRARGVTLYAALRALGRRGVAELVERSCRHAALMADLLRADPCVEILHDVALNVVLLRCHPRPASPGSDDPEASDECTRAVVQRVRREGTCWTSGLGWRGREAMQLTFCHWATTEEDVRRSAEAILRACADVRRHLFSL